jgi:hypothetical protein
MDLSRRWRMRRCLVLLAVLALVSCGVLVSLASSEPWPENRQLLGLNDKTLQKVIGDPTAGLPEVLPVLSGLDRALNMAVGPDGLVYIADTGKRSIVRCDANGRNLTVIMKSGSLSPYDLSFDEEGNLFFSTFARDLSCGTSMGVWKIPGAQPGATPEKVLSGGDIKACTTISGYGPFSMSPLCVVTSGPHKGDILVGGKGSITIVRAVAPDYTSFVPFVKSVQGVFDPYGSGTVDIPVVFTDFCMLGTNGNVVATDWINGRILEFDPEGNFLRVVAKLYRANLITTDRSGNIYASGAVFGGRDFQQIVGFSREGERLFQIPITDVRAVAVVE